MRVSTPATRPAFECAAASRYRGLLGDELNSSRSDRAGGCPATAAPGAELPTNAAGRPPRGALAERPLAADDADLAGEATAPAAGGATGRSGRGGAAAAAAAPDDTLNTMVSCLRPCATESKSTGMSRSPAHFLSGGIEARPERVCFTGPPSLEESADRPTATNVEAAVSAPSKTAAALVAGAGAAGATRACEPPSRPPRAPRPAEEDTDFLRACCDFRSTPAPPLSSPAAGWADDDDDDDDEDDEDDDEADEWSKELVE